MCTVALALPAWFPAGDLGLWDPGAASDGDDGVGGMDAPGMMDGTGGFGGGLEDLEDAVAAGGCLGSLGQSHWLGLGGGDVGGDSSYEDVCRWDDWALGLWVAWVGLNWQACLDGVETSRHSGHYWWGA